MYLLGKSYLIATIGMIGAGLSCCTFRAVTTPREADIAGETRTIGHTAQPRASILSAWRKRVVKWLWKHFDDIVERAIQSLALGPLDLQVRVARHGFFEYLDNLLLGDLR